MSFKKCTFLEFKFMQAGKDSNVTQDTALVIRGDSLDVSLEYYEHELMELVAAAPAVVCCRCSPEQKAAVVRLTERHSGK